MAALVAAGAAMPTASAASFTTYRLGLSGEYSGHGITKVSCIRSLPEGETETYVAQGSASESTKFRTTSLGKVTFIPHAGPEPEMTLDLKPRVRLNVTRSNVAPEGCEPAPADSEPPPPSTRCGTGSAHARGFLGIDRGRRGSTALRVDVGLVTVRTGDLLDRFSDPFLPKPSSAYPSCLMPNGQQWMTPLPECSTTRSAPVLRKRRLFAGAGRITLTQHTEGPGAATDFRGNPVAGGGGHPHLRCGDTAASSYTMTVRISLTRIPRGAR
ncbi:MAG TPA: hypothetical protein VK486_05530 [Thermoleophilaceae bacterium]|nr:hypothetical protein [Thermoleophilaceae bacterium]